jgi:hypothetical protein
MVNLMMSTTIQGAQKAMDPPVQVPDDGFVLPIKTRPASINYYRAGSNGKDRIEPIFNDTRIDFGFQILDAHRAQIRDSFYVNQLMMQQGPQETAPEVVQKAEENFRFLGPLLGRVEREWVAPIIERVYGIMERRGMFLPPPPELQGKPLNVRFSSTIAKIQKMAASRNILEVLNVVGPFIQFDPHLVDHFNLDNIVRGTAQNFALQADFLRDDREVKKMKEARALAEQEALKQQQEAHEAGVAGQVLPAAAQMQMAQNASPVPEEEL